jgi:hypothetical protein
MQFSLLAFLGSTPSLFASLLSVAVGHRGSANVVYTASSELARLLRVNPNFRTFAPGTQVWNPNCQVKCGPCPLRTRVSAQLSSMRSRRVPTPELTPSSRAAPRPRSDEPEPLISHLHRASRSSRSARRAPGSWPPMHSLLRLARITALMHVADQGPARSISCQRRSRSPSTRTARSRGP